jgi:hypothetical protein
MKATMSKDGVMRITVPVKVRVGLGEIVSAVAVDLFSFGVPVPEIGPMEVLRRLTRWDCIKAVEKHATGLDDLWVRVEDEVSEADLAVCRQRVAKLFPELA